MDALHKGGVRADEGALGAAGTNSQRQKYQQILSFDLVPVSCAFILEFLHLVHPQFQRR